MKINLSWALEKKFWGKIKFFEYLKKSISNKKFNYSCVILRDNLRSQIVALKVGFRFNKMVGKKFIFLKIIFYSIYEIQLVLKFSETTVFFRPSQ